MKVVGFSFLRNGVQFGYPFKQSILSVLPLVDEFVINLGNSEDNTQAEIDSLPQEKIKQIHSTWCKDLMRDGKVLAAETNKSKAAVPDDADWLFYIQADEVIHEKEYDEIRKQMLKYKDDDRVDGLLFRYYHFYGSFSLLGDGRGWYPFEIRIIKNNPDIVSYRDAQGFRFKNGKKLRVKRIRAHIYHYGWVRNPILMKKKQAAFRKLYRGEKAEAENANNPGKGHDYSKIDSLTQFKGSHPAIMADLVAAQNWEIERDVNKKYFKNLKHRLYYYLHKKFGIRPFAYKNYKLI